MRLPLIPPADLTPEQKALYDRFKLDEPWDSPNNLPLLSQMPKVFQDLSAEVDPTETVYQVFVGPHSAEVQNLVESLVETGGFYVVDNETQRTLARVSRCLADVGAPSD